MFFILPCAWHPSPLQYGGCDDRYSGSLGCARQWIHSATREDSRRSWWRVSRTGCARRAVRIRKDRRGGPVCCNRLTRTFCGFRCAALALHYPDVLASGCVNGAPGRFVISIPRAARPSIGLRASGGQRVSWDPLRTTHASPRSCWCWMIWNPQRCNSVASIAKALQRDLGAFVSRVIVTTRELTPMRDGRLGRRAPTRQSRSCNE